MAGKRIVIETRDRCRIECDGENHWYVDTQGEVTGMSVNPPHIISPCAEPEKYREAVEGGR